MFAFFAPVFGFLGTAFRLAAPWLLGLFGVKVFSEEAGEKAGPIIGLALGAFLLFRVLK